jgi:hypothetical protein
VLENADWNQKGTDLGAFYKNWAAKDPDFDSLALRLAASASFTLSSLLSAESTWRDRNGAGLACAAKRKRPPYITGWPFFMRM